MPKGQERFVMRPEKEIAIHKGSIIVILTLVVVTVATAILFPPSLSPWDAIGRLLLTFGGGVFAGWVSKRYFGK